MHQAEVISLFMKSSFFTSVCLKDDLFFEALIFKYLFIQPDIDMLLSIMCHHCTVVFFFWGLRVWNWMYIVSISQLDVTAGPIAS